MTRMGLIERIRGDITFLRGLWRALRATTPIARNPHRVFPAIVDGLAEKYADAPALLSDRESFSYRQLAERANRYARWALANQIGKGEVVCLLMPNRPEFMAFWLGVTRAGGVVALLNTNLTGSTLAHCINIVAPKHIVVAAELSGAFATARPLLATNAKVWQHGPNGSDWPRIEHEVDALSGAPLAAADVPALTIEDRALFVYTSGTTGLPKAANINHYRLMLASFGFGAVMDTRPTDRMYDCLPMYHTTGGVVATGALLVNGGSTVLREKFSAHEFWDDIVRWDCTMFQYIGELCRYLINTPPSPNETRHHIRLCCGNGLRPDVWPEMKKRFRLPLILEFYAATEGNCSMFNVEGKEGAVGRLPWFLEHRFPIKIVRFDVEKEEVVRSADGFCVECDVNEPGELIGKIVNDPLRPGNRFEGYADPNATEKKILRNVFERGDAWFRTGDLMRKDERGYFYFVDRIGDTFRWKGENVSTAEVAQMIGPFPGVLEVNVYGVRVPGKEGRVGMAALIIDKMFDLAAFHAHLVRTLPEYARPLFLRIRDEIEVTGTFKQKKLELVARGFDPSQTHEAIFFNDAERKAFVRIDAPLFERIQTGQVRI
jgi:fatty-acyl-CoA synthase